MWDTLEVISTDLHSSPSFLKFISIFIYWGFIFFFNRSQLEGVSEALHVVSLALENNQTCLQLWLLYLRLYSRQNEADRADYNEVCERALENQPNYQIFCIVSYL